MILLLILTLLDIKIIFSQTVIEAMFPADAHVILLEVDDPKKADIIVYKTNVKEEYEEWNCKWKFKKWGFANFYVYITKDEEDPMLFDEELEITYPIHGKVYFTENKEEARYVNPNFRLEGIMRKIFVDKSPEAIKSKEEFIKKHSDEEK